MHAADPPLPLIEILALERASMFGAPAFATAARALHRRLVSGLGDEETLVRLAGVLHAASEAPAWQLGGEERQLPEFASALRTIGGDESLSAESCFGLGYLSQRCAALLDEDTANRLLDRAAGEVSSPLLRDSHWFAGVREATATERIQSARSDLLAEIRARFAGRGLYGERLRQDLTTAVRSAGRQPRLG